MSLEGNKYYCVLQHNRMAHIK